MNLCANGQVTERADSTMQGTMKLYVHCPVFNVGYVERAVSVEPGSRPQNIPVFVLFKNNTGYTMALNNTTLDLARSYNCTKTGVSQLSNEG